ncbi:cell division protein PerM [Nakamurella lactea]|uniref:cell division protein PerM n=1 Tax=Nakamurella lactea TaxID=459515 RepID=UPI0004921580|nr:DUF6350 family protein [Nakamurella lactea]
MSPASASPPAAGPITAPVGRHLAVCVVRALAAVVAALLLACGVGLLIWAITPSSGSATEVVRAAVTGLGAANFLPPTVGGIVLTLPPLTFTAVCFVLVASAANRGRTPGIGPALELVGALVVGLVYGAVLTAVIAALAPAGAASNVGRGWAPVLLGVVAAALGVMLRATVWRGWWRGRAPLVARAGVRAGGAALLLVVAGGAVATAAGLITSFGTAIDLSSIAAPSVGDSIGMVLLSIAFLPNAVIAGAGYVTGIGFQIGVGTYSPLGTTGIELPALPLLAAVPDSGGVSGAGLVLLIFPVAAAVLIGWMTVRRLGTRRDRMIAALLASAVAAVGMMMLAIVSAGGVVGSPWAHLGVPVAGIGAVTFGGLGAVSLTIAAVAGWGTVQWVDRPAVEAAATAAATAGVSPPADPENPSPVAEIAGSGAESGELETSSQDDSVETADPPEDAADRHH